MAGQRELKKHLAGIKTTGKLANAMKTVATAKFSRLSALRADIDEYSRCCAELLGDFDIPALFGDSEGGADCLYIMLTGNKGLCGGYNSDIVAFYMALEKAKGHKLVVCGKKGFDLCRQKGVEAEYFEISDMPSEADATRLEQLIKAEHTEYGEVRVIYSDFKNVMKQIPTELVLLSAAHVEAETPFMFFPTRAEAANAAASACLHGVLYGVLVDAAIGAQAATLMTMRNAADNAEEEAARTELLLNRVRQSELTSDVIESASGAIENLNS